MHDCIVSKKGSEKVLRQCTEQYGNRKHPSIHPFILTFITSYSYTHIWSLQSACLCGYVGRSWCIWRKPTQAGGEHVNSTWNDWSWNRTNSPVATWRPCFPRHHCVTSVLSNRVLFEMSMRFDLHVRRCHARRL